MRQDHNVSRYMLDKTYRTMIPDTEVWEKNRSNQLRIEQTWFTDGALISMVQGQGFTNIEAKFNGVFY